MNTENTNQELDWNDEIENTGTIDIPDGEYDFIVDHYERSKVGGEGKYAGQNMAVIYCNILAGDAEPQIRTNIILNENFRWKLSQFFVSLGLMKDEKGAKLKMNWNMVGGSRGRCKIEHKPNYNDATKTHLEITEFLKPQGGKKWGSGF